jgi:hypothetical protein
MKKLRILALKNIYKLNNISLYEIFVIACEDVSMIRYSSVSPIVQCRVRADQIAFPFVAMWLDLNETVIRQANTQ